MKQKLFLKYSLVLIMTPFVSNCSSIPEIQSYETPGYTVEQLQGSSEPRDAVFQIEPIDMNDSEEPAEISENEAVEQEAEQAASAIIDESEPVNLEEAPAMSSPKKKVSRGIASAPVKNGFYTFKNSCTMKAEADSASSDVGQVNAGKKLWLDHHDSQWFKVYKKSGTAYISANCINK